MEGGAALGIVAAGIAIAVIVAVVCTLRRRKVYKTLAEREDEIVAQRRESRRVRDELEQVQKQLRESRRVNEERAAAAQRAADSAAGPAAQRATLRGRESESHFPSEGDDDGSHKLTGVVKRGNSRIHRRKSSLRHKEKTDKAFAKLDADGNGTLDEMEFKSVCMKDFEGSAAGQVAASLDIAKLFEMLDEDMSGDIEVKELRHALRHSPEAMALASKFDALHDFVEAAELKNKKVEFKKLFKSLDGDGSGALDFDELKAVCMGGEHASPEATEENLHKLFDLCDEDHGGTVDCHELRHVLKKNKDALALALHFPALTHLVELAAARAGKAKHKKKRKASAAVKRKMSIRSGKSMRGKMKRKGTLKSVGEAVEAGNRLSRKRKGSRRGSGGGSGGAVKTKSGRTVNNTGRRSLVKKHAKGMSDDRRASVAALAANLGKAKGPGIASTGSQMKMTVLDPKSARRGSVVPTAAPAIGGGGSGRTSSHARWMALKKSKSNFTHGRRKKTFRQVSRQLSMLMADANTDSKWEKKVDPKTKKPYWVHKLTGKSVWEDPTK